MTSTCRSGCRSPIPAETDANWSTARWWPSHGTSRSKKDRIELGKCVKKLDKRYSAQDLLVAVDAGGLGFNAAVRFLDALPPEFRPHVKDTARYLKGLGGDQMAELIPWCRPLNPDRR